MEPTYKKFDAVSPQFSDIGKAMYDSWFSVARNSTRAEMFSRSDIGNLLEWMWHEIQGYKAVIFEKDKIIEKLRNKK